MFQLSLARNWLLKYNNKYQKYENSESIKYKKSNCSRVCYIGIGMLLLIVLISCLIATSSTAVYNSSFEKTSINSISTIPNHITTNPINFLRRPSTSTEFLKSSTLPLKRPQVYSNNNDNNNMNLKPITNFSNTSVNILVGNNNNNIAREYLLEREDSQPIYYEKTKNHPKVKINIQSRNKYNYDFYENNLKNYNKKNNNKPLNVKLTTIHDQIPRPPRLNNYTFDHINRRQFTNDLEKPRPFHFPRGGLQPTEFRKKRKISRRPLRDYTVSATVNNIQDIIHNPEYDNFNQHQHNWEPSLSGVQFLGKYRHLKSKGILQLFGEAKKRYNLNLGKTQNEVATNQQGSKLNYPIDQTEEDRFYPFKPKSPSEVNLLALKHYRNQLPKPWKKPKIEQFQENIGSSNSHVDSTYNIANKPQNEAANEAQKKPFSLMLDIYPITNNNNNNQNFGYQDNNIPSTTQHSFPKQRKPNLPKRKRPKSENFFNQPDSYYNSINFPQIQQNNFPQSSNFFQNTYLNQKYHDQDDKFKFPYQDDQNIKSNQNYETLNKNPNQIMFQLNLIPKKKIKTRTNDNFEYQNPNYDYDTFNGDSDNFQRKDTIVQPVNHREMKTLFKFDKPIIVANMEKTPIEIFNKINNSNSCCNVLPSESSIIVGVRKNETLSTTERSQVTKFFKPNTINNFSISEDNLIKFNENDVTVVTVKSL